MALKSYRGLRFCTDTCILSVLTPTDFHHGWAIFGPLVDKTLERGISRAPSQRKVFRTLFIHVLRWQFETWHKHLAGGVTHQVRVSLQSGQLTYVTAKNRQTSFICIHGLQNYIEAPDLVHKLIWWVSWPLLIFVMVGQFLALWRTKTLERGWGGVGWGGGRGWGSRAPSQRKVFQAFFSTCFEIWTWNLVYTSGGLHDTSGLSFITIGSLPLDSFLGPFFLNVLRYQLESWFIHSLGRTTYGVHISPEWGPCDILHVLSVGAVN